MTDTDPPSAIGRSASDDHLQDFLDRVFAPEGAQVTVTDSGLFQNATAYHEPLLVIGFRGSPKFLASPGPLVKAITAHAKLRTPKDRLTRMMAASALALGVGRRRKRVSFARSFEISVSAGRDPQVALIHKSMAQVAGLATTRIMVVLRPIDDHYKPTITLLADDGEPAGFAKLGWTPKTAAMVRRETAALQHLGTTLGPNIVVPELLGAGEHFGRPFLVSAPMPDKASRAPIELPDNSIIQELGGPVRQAETAMLLADVQAAGVSAAARGDQLRSQLLLAASSQLRHQWGDQLAVTRLHGDWVPWNVATYLGRYVVWDWEHFRESAPVGLDAFHWVMLSNHLLHGKSWLESFQIAEQTLQSRLPTLGTDMSSQQLSLFHAAHLTARSETLRTIDGNEPFPLDTVVADLVQRTSSRKESD